MTEFTPTIEDQIKSTILQAIEEAHKEQVLIIEKTIQEKVNGKIDKIQVQMNGQDTKLREIADAVDKLKDDTDPLVTMRTVAISLGKFIMWIGGIIIILGGIYKIFWHK